MTLYGVFLHLIFVNLRQKNIVLRVHNGIIAVNDEASNSVAQ